MAGPSVTHTFLDGATIFAAQHNTNFSDAIGWGTSGTVDWTVAALTATGTATFNGNVVIGNTTSDTITFTGLAASALSPSANQTYALGTSDLGWNGIYLGSSSGNAHTTLLKASGSNAADITLTLPADDGSAAGECLVTDGSGVMSWSQIRRGKTTHGAVTTGYVGEIQLDNRLRSAGTSPAASGTVVNVTASGITLGQGNWLIGGMIGVKPGSMTALTQMNYGINTTSATLPVSDDTLCYVDLSTPTAVTKFVQSTASFTPASEMHLSVGPFPAYVTTSTTYYLVWSGIYSTNNPTIYGSFYAIRIS